MNKEEKRPTYGDLYAENFRLTHNNRVLQQRIDKVNKFCEKQKVKMYKNRNKIAMFNLIKIEKILKGDSDV